MLWQHGMRAEHGMRPQHETFRDRMVQCTMQFLFAFRLAMCDTLTMGRGDGVGYPSPPVPGVTSMIFNIQVSKINTVESFDDTKLPEVSKVHVFNYGLTQLLNDAHAGCTEKAYPVEADRLAEARRRVGLKVDQI